MIARGSHPLRLNLLAGRHLVLNLQLAVGLKLLMLSHLRLRLLGTYLLLRLRLLGPHVLLRLGLLGSHVLLRLGLLGSHVLLSLRLPDLVGMHLLPLLHLRRLASMDLRLRVLCYRRAILMLRGLGGEMHTATARSERAGSRTLELSAGAAAGRKSRTGDSGCDSGMAPATAANRRSAIATNGGATAAASRSSAIPSVSVVAARAGNGRCSDR